MHFVLWPLLCVQMSASILRKSQSVSMHPKLIQYLPSRLDGVWIKMFPGKKSRFCIFPLLNTLL